MSPHVANRFTGHMDEGDPRDLMWGCGGCTHPSVVAYNYLLASTNAWGVLSFLNTDGIQLKPNSPFGSSWQCSWIFNGPPSIVTTAVMIKYYPIGFDSYRFDLMVSTLLGTFFSITDFERQSCNVTHMLTPAEMGGPPPIGGTGDGFRLLQVEWDETRPPDGWP